MLDPHQRAALEAEKAQLKAEQGLLPGESHRDEKAIQLLEGSIAALRASGLEGRK
ncbi:MAG TPA: hypothetical protein H9867_04345 [Candidatus Corynebacterium gallistercoris]|uniref:Uncharacterized protein n=1 Tax=Candidatus Corynebacterium gallistercoris TaxID=2838530 RepID=A0A9D1UPS2_9CORY|nr:hypothetical protein [Candidatus Corynebacterium gallistercoris]